MIPKAEEQREPASGECIYNHGVRCGSADHCEKCGWNPAVAEKRAETITTKHEGKGQHLEKR